MAGKPPRDQNQCEVVMPEKSEVDKANPVEIARNTQGTPTAKLIAILIANGITDTKTLSEIIGLKPRAIQCARSAAQCAQQNAPAQCNAPDAQQVAPSAAQCAETAPSLACADKTTRATKESLRDSSYLEDRKNPQTPNGGFHDIPSNVIPVKSWNTAFDQFDPSAEIIRDQSGRIRLLGGTRERWLADFGSEKTLDLVLTEITGEINEGSRKPLVADTEARLAKKLRAKIESDQRYIAAAAANKAAQSAPRKLSRWG